MRLVLYKAGIVWPPAWPEAMALGEYLSYRVVAYMLLNVVEDPAWLAWAFC